MPSEDPRNRSKTVGKYLRYWNLGFQFFVAIGVFTFAGVWLDRKAETGALFTILGSTLGFAAGFYSIYRELYPSRGGRRSDGMQGGGRVSDAKSADSGGRNRGQGKGRPSEGDRGD